MTQNGKFELSIVVVGHSDGELLAVADLGFGATGRSPGVPSAGEICDEQFCDTRLAGARLDNYFPFSVVLLRVGTARRWHTDQRGAMRREFFAWKTPLENSFMRRAIACRARPCDARQFAKSPRRGHAK